MMAQAPGISPEGMVLLQLLCGGSFQVPKSTLSTHKHRLKQNGTKKLYHQTSPESAKLILDSQEFKKGTNGGLAGNGIYFAESPKETDHKAKNKGVVLCADVYLGKTLPLGPDGDHTMTLEKLFTHGCDSVSIARNGKEWVVYRSEQVRNIREMVEVSPGKWKEKNAGTCPYGSKCYRKNPEHIAKYHGDVCPYGSKCYRKNPEHIAKYHSETTNTSTDTSAGTGDVCPYGSKCYRKNPEHIAKYHS